MRQLAAQLARYYSVHCKYSTTKYCIGSSFPKSRSEYMTKDSSEGPRLRKCLGVQAHHDAERPAHMFHRTMSCPIKLIDIWFNIRSMAILHVSLFYCFDLPASQLWKRIVTSGQWGRLYCHTSGRIPLCCLPVNEERRKWVEIRNAIQMEPNYENCY